MSTPAGERNRSGRGANRASRLGRIFDAAAVLAETTHEPTVVLLSDAIERQAPRQRLRLDDVRLAFASFFYGEQADFRDVRRAEQKMNGRAPHETASVLRDAASFYRGGD